MRRTSCLVLSRYHSNTQKETIEATVQALPPTDQNKYINKLYAVAVLKCEESITQSEVQEVRYQSFSSTLKILISIQQHFSTLLKELTTPKSLIIWRQPKSKMPSLNSPKSLTRKCKSRMRKKRPRSKRKVEPKKNTK
jgi:hypothetical protein